MKLKNGSKFCFIYNSNTIYCMKRDTCVSQIATPLKRILKIVWSFNRVKQKSNLLYFPPCLICKGSDEAGFITPVETSSHNFLFNDSHATTISLYRRNVSHKIILRLSSTCIIWKNEREKKTTKIKEFIRFLTLRQIFFYPFKKGTCSA